MVKSPALVVVVEVETPVSRFVTLTVALTTDAPWGSVTAPVIVPRSSWPNEMLAVRIRMQAQNETRKHRETNIVRLFSVEALYADFFAKTINLNYSIRYQISC